MNTDAPLEEVRILSYTSLHNSPNFTNMGIAKEEGVAIRRDRDAQRVRRGVRDGRHGG